VRRVTLVRARLRYFAPTAARPRRATLDEVVGDDGLDDVLCAALRHVAADAIAGGGGRVGGEGGGGVAANAGLVVTVKAGQQVGWDGREAPTIRRARQDGEADDGATQFDEQAGGVQTGMVHVVPRESH